MCFLSWSVMLPSSKRTVMRKVQYIDSVSRPRNKLLANHERTRPMYMKRTPDRIKQWCKLRILNIFLPCHCCQIVNWPLFKLKVIEKKRFSFNFIFIYGPALVSLRLEQTSWSLGAPLLPYPGRCYVWYPMICQWVLSCLKQATNWVSSHNHFRKKWPAWRLKINI